MNEQNASGAPCQTPGLSVPAKTRIVRRKCIRLFAVTLRDLRPGGREMI